MSEDFASSAALGYLAGSYSGAQTGKAVLALMSGLRQRAEAVDVNALLQALQEQDQYIGEQNAYIEALRREVAELRAHSARVEKNRDDLDEYATWAQAELQRRPSIG